MAALWNVEIIELQGDLLRLRLRVAHPDAGRFPLSKQFALRLLLDKALDFNDRFERVAIAPVGEEVSVDDIDSLYDEAFMKQNAGRFIASVDISDVENAPFHEEAAHRQVDAEVLARGVSRADRAAWDEAWDARWRAFWAEPSNLPSATYTIRVTEPRYLSHLSAGQSWRSASYCGVGPFA